MRKLLVCNAIVWCLRPPTTPPRRFLTHRAAPTDTAAGAREIVLISGFESFNCALYEKCAQSVNDDVRVTVFSDRDVQSRKEEVAAALDRADAFVGSLLFDYDDVEWLAPRVRNVKGPRLVFECATELMEFNRVGSFEMKGGGGPPPAVKAVLSKFGSGREEDKLQGYLKMLKIGPQLLKFIPNDTAQDLRSWLELYRFWNEGGEENVESMLRVLFERHVAPVPSFSSAPAVVETPPVGCLHPLAPGRYFLSPREYLDWRLSADAAAAATAAGAELASAEAPRVAVLLFRKHVITKQPYVWELITQMEAEGLQPVPIFINGVEAHTIVRDVLTSVKEEAGTRETSYRPQDAASVDAIVNTIGFPLVGGPAGSMEAGRGVAEGLLGSMDVPYYVAAPLLLQDIASWRQSGVTGLQSVVLYALPELDGAVDAVVLGALEGDDIVLEQERVTKLCERVARRTKLRNTPAHDRKVGLVLYGFPPNVGAVGTAALLNVPRSLDAILATLSEAGYDTTTGLSGEALVAGVAWLCRPDAINGGAARMVASLEAAARRAKAGDPNVAEALREFIDEDDALRGDVTVVADAMSHEDIGDTLTKEMRTRLDACWSAKDRDPALGCAADGSYVVSGLQVGNVFVGCQPLLGVEGDPMRLLFERDLTPHPQYVSFYDRLDKRCDAVVHVGMHGTVEWLPGQALGNDKESWSDVLLGGLPNLYLYAANNPSESILAKRRGYATLISYLSPPYARAGTYGVLAELKELLADADANDDAFLAEVDELVAKAALENEVPTRGDDVKAWVAAIRSRLAEVENRLFSSGLRAFGEAPDAEGTAAFLEAYFDGVEDAPSAEALAAVVRSGDSKGEGVLDTLRGLFFEQTEDESALGEAQKLKSALHQSTEELSSLVTGLDGGYVAPKPGGDVLRDGLGVLPTGRNTYALDPYRMPSKAAFRRGALAAERVLDQHRAANGGAYPETVAVTMWGLDAIKTKGESVAMALALVGATVVSEGTGRVARFELMPLAELGRPRVDVLASLSGIFRDTFENVVLLLDDLFERAAAADEPAEMNYVRKHALELESQGAERPAARLFSNPAGDYGSMVNERVGSGDLCGEWDESSSLGDTWASRNAFSYGRGDKGSNRADVLQSLLKTTERVVQEIDSVEYGLTDIQEYYANTGALKVAAENASGGKKCSVSIVEAFRDDADGPQPKDLDDVLRLEYRSKLLNPRWAEAMLEQGSGGAYEVSSRFTAMVGWGAVNGVDDFVWDGASEKYALDDAVSEQLRRSNPEAYRNVLARLLEAAGRGMWNADEDVLRRLREKYADADDSVEGVA